ncbi:MAG: SEL1-like repeat protein [Betaproteobacteria bacterium]|nr:SEL1-like repeat protein [Betaproteobacteria bacterium]MDE2423551.1 SEL1-like repeat protein [Betaproteobacteria bacterium]
MNNIIFKNFIAVIVLVFMSTQAWSGYYESKQAFDQHNYPEAYQQCLDSATQGNRDCQNAIGFLYREGLGVKKNLQQAQQWFLLAANQGLGNAQYNLAILLGSGELGYRSEQEQAKWMSKAALNGIAKAQNNLGTFFSLGIGVIQNDQQAVLWWKKAAEQHNAMAENNLGWAYATGIGIELNPLEAQRWLQQAVNQQQNLTAKHLAQDNLLKLGLIPSAIPPKNNTLPLKVDIGQVDSLGNVSLTLVNQNQIPIHSLVINGERIETHNENTVHVSHYIPVGDSYVDVYAKDDGQNEFNQQYLVHRVIDSSNKQLPALHPQQINLTKREDAVAIIIGAQYYHQLPQSEFSDNDAKSFYDYAVRALGVDPNKVKLLTGSEANRNTILYTLKNWLGAEVNSGKTKVYLYYSGHGLASIDGKKRYLLPTDTNITLLDDTAISQENLINVVESYQPASLTMFIDSCYSGRAKSGTPLLTAMRPIVLHSDFEIPAKGVTIFSSSQGDQLSAVSDRAQHGIFSYYLMRGMEGEADLNHDHQITADELFHYLEERVAKESLRQGLQQTPVLMGDVNEVLIHE